MKGPVRFLLVAMMLVVAAACSKVESTQILGTPLSDEEAQKFEGIWVLNDFMPLYVRHRGDGVVEFVHVGGDDESFELVEHSGVLARDDDVVYLNVEKKAKASDEAVTYDFIRITPMGDDTLFVHAASDDGFAAAVESGELSGTVEKGKARKLMPAVTRIRIDATAEELAEFVQPDKASQQFNLELPAYLHRLTRYDEPDG